MDESTPHADEPRVVDIPSILTDAVRRYKVDGLGGASWTYHQCANGASRQSVDDYLVARMHPLAYEAGTAEQRFYAIVKELADTL